MNTEYVYLRNTLSTGNRSSEEGTETVIEKSELTKKDLSDLQRDPSILAFTPNMPVELIKPVELLQFETSKKLDISSDYALNTQTNMLGDTDECTWGVQAVRANQSRYTGKGAIVAILDTGIDASHERFSSVDITFKNFTDETDEDLAGHGTHCSGTVFGQNIEGKPRIGIATNIEKAIIGKVLGSKGGSTEWIANGIQWAASEGAHIISMSLGSSIVGIFSTLQKNGMNVKNALSISFNYYQSNVKFYNSIVKYIQRENRGSVIIAASGNESGRFVSEESNSYDAPCGTPAIAEGIISVGALGILGDMINDPSLSEEQKHLMTIASFSNYSNDISGPGYKVLSSFPGNKYEHLGGTSMATPHVAGVAALWVQKQLETLGYVNLDMLKYQLQGNATMDSIISNIQSVNIDPSDFGVGLVQAP